MITTPAARVAACRLGFARRLRRSARDGRLTLVLLLVGLAAGGAAQPGGPAEFALALPSVGDHELTILGPTLLEVTVVSTRPPDPAGEGFLDYARYESRKALPAHFEVTVEGKPAAVRRVGFKRRVLYAPLKRRDLRIGNHFYLELETPIGDSQTVEVKDRTDKIWVQGKVLRATADPLRWSPVVHVNQVGYLPDAPKQALVGYYLGSLGEMNVPASAGFRLVAAANGREVFRGQLTPRRDQGYDFPAYQQVWQADFSAFTTPGEYRLVVPGLGASFPFWIDEGVAAAFVRTYALGLYHQRCGAANALPYTRFTHGPCHTARAEVPTMKFRRTQEFLAAMSGDYRQDPDHSAPQLKDVASSLFPFVRQGAIDVSGGHHDAGDYSKYTINSAALIHYLVFAVDAFAGVGELDNLGLPESGDGKSDLLQEAKWEADFLAKLQDGDGGFYFLVYPRERKYEDDVLPERGDPQVVWPKNTSATAAAVAALAQTASSPLFQRQFPEAARLYLEKAKLGWAFLQKAIERHGWKGAYQKLTHYGDTFRHDDEIIWAATEMFLATRDPKIHKFLQTNFDPASANTRRWTWWRLYEGYGCAVRSYAFALKTKRLSKDEFHVPLLARCRAEILAAGEDQLRYAQENAYGTSFPTSDKRFRSASYFFPSDRAFDLAVAYQVEARPAFLEALWGNLNYEAGANPVNVAFLTGVGWKRQREIVHQFAQNDHRVLPPSGIPLSSIQSGFAYLNPYQKQLGALSFPPDGDRQRPYPFYDRWGDSFNVSTEFVHVNQARSLAALAFLAAQTPLKTQAWNSAPAHIRWEVLSEKPMRLKATLEVPGLDVRAARIVWEARDREPTIGTVATLAPVNVGPQWVEAEAQWPDGRRAFAVTNFFARHVAPRAIVSKFQAAPRAVSPATVALFHLDENLRDAVDPSRQLKPAGAPLLDSSNLAWMRQSAGAALRLDGPADRATVVLPAADVCNRQTRSITLEAVLFVNQFEAPGAGNGTLLSLAKKWNASLELVQDRWAAAPGLKGGNRTLVPPEKMAALLTPAQWHRLRITLDREGYRIAVDETEVARLAAKDLEHWSGAGDVTLQAGSFDGWLDELAVVREP